MIPGADPRNILKDKDNIKIPWETKIIDGMPRTRKELLEKRKLDKIPDISYDLDGDGYVGGRDYVISKRFDEDKDGKLNENEKRNALNAIKNGVEKEYVWNLENQGVNRACRVLQKVSLSLFREEKSSTLKILYHCRKHILDIHYLILNLKQLLYQSCINEEETKQKISLTIN